MTRHNNQGYGTVSRFLHWLIASLILIMLGLGWGGDVVPKAWKPLWMGTHKSLGIIVLVLAIVRLLWRLYKKPPPFPEYMSRMEKIAALAAHWALYGFLFAMPLTGWAMTSAKGRPILFLGVIPLPDLVGADYVFGKWLEDIHEDLAFLLATTIFLHVSAALYHHSIKKDGVLSRMWPISPKKQGA